MSKIMFAILLAFPVFAGVTLLAPSPSDSSEEQTEAPVVLDSAGVDSDLADPTDLLAQPALPHCAIEVDSCLVEPRLLATDRCRKEKEHA